MPPPRTAAARYVLVVLASVVAIAIATERRQAPLRAQAPGATASPTGAATATTCVIGPLVRGGELRACVHELAVRGHKKRSPDTVATKILTVSEENPANTAEVIDVYFDQSMAKEGTPKRPWEMEHAWPKTYGFDEDKEDCNVPLADAHHLFVSHPTANGPSGHWTLPFGDCDHDCTPMPAGAPRERQNRRGRDADGNLVFEVWRGRRGDIARAMLYMDVRYSGDATTADVASNGGACHLEPDLLLVENVVERGGLDAEGIARYGRLSTIVRWALEDPVDERERRRNEVIAQPDMQGNRNPFIDDEGLICRLYPVGWCRLPLYLPSVVRP